MRSCASRGARSPGSARKSSSCSRSLRLRWRMGLTGSAARLAGWSDGRRLALRRQHGPDARVGSRSLGAAIDPGLQILQAVDDAAAELRIARTRAVDAMLLKRADR